MTRHAWITTVFEDIAAYAERNALPEVERELRATAGRLGPLLECAPDLPQRDAPCDVLPLPRRRV